MKHFTVLVACVVLVAPVADAQTQASGNQGKTWQDIKTLPDFTVIGYATDVTSKNMLRTKSDNQFEIKAQGWPNSQ